MLEFVLNLFFPPVCGICGKNEERWICKNCKKELDLKKKSIIMNTFGQNYKETGFLFLYKDIRNLILDYKFEGKSYLSYTFATLILEDKKICEKIRQYDMIVPIPMSRRKKSKRGYNQTELIARKLAKSLGIQYNQKSLIKIKNNKMQSSLNGKERIENVKNVYGIKNKELIENKKIILFDDILTTGATVNECSNILRQNGAKEIFVLTIAKD